MRNPILLSMAFVAASTVLASAQDRRIEERRVEERPGIVVPLPIPQVGVERRERVETDGRGPAGCESKTVKKETPEGQTTIRKERCD